jgi:hypothetical protein
VTKDQSPADSPLIDAEAAASSELTERGERFELRDAFLLRQEQLLAVLGVGRAIGGHPVVVGDAAELNWRGMLESIFPLRYQVAKAFVVDSRGNKSEQIDLLIFDRQFSPVLIDVGEYLFIPAEAVYAVFEIKQQIDRDAILYAAGKIASVRKLHRTSAPIPHAGGEFDPRELPRILGGVLSLASGWVHPFGDPLAAALASASQDGSVDLGCALSAGSWEVDETGHLTLSDQQTALIFFVLRLMMRLQRMATVPAIAYEAYAAALNVDTDPEPS